MRFEGADLSTCMCAFNCVQNKHNKVSVQPWWLGSLGRVTNSSRHYPEIGGSNPASGMYMAP